MASRTIKSPVTGVVWQMVAGVGDRVGGGEVVLLMEAMKMEIPVEMPESGTLTEILVSESDFVEEGQEVARYEA